MIIFFVLFSIWQLWVPEALDDWRWGSEVGIMRLKTWFEGYNGRYFGDILVIVLTRLPIVLRSMAISGIMTAMLYLIYQLTEYKILSFLICVFFVVNIPTSLMSQTYGWVSGFSNFCDKTELALVRENEDGTEEVYQADYDLRMLAGQETVKIVFLLSGLQDEKKDRYFLKLTRCRGNVAIRFANEGGEERLYLR